MTIAAPMLGKRLADKKNTCMFAHVGRVDRISGEEESFGWAGGV